MKRILFVLTLPAILFGLSGCGNDAGSRWYDYGNGKVNLNQVSHIKPTFDYYLTLASDSLEDINKNYSESITEESSDRLIESLNLEEISKQPFYRVRLKASVHFDLFELTLYESEDYIKRPSTYQVNDYLLGKLRENGLDSSSMGTISALKGQVFSTKEAFLEALAGTEVLNMDNYWVSNQLPIYGLGEAGSKFFNETQNVKADKLLDANSLEALKKGIKESLKNYQDIPA